jgi:hypothetical protein
MSPDFHQSIAQHKNLSEAEQRKAGQAIAAPMDEKYNAFLKEVIEIIDSGAIDLTKPETLLHPNVYEALTAEQRNAVDLALINIIHQLRIVVEFYKSTKTPNESPQLQTMIEQLWLMKQRIEDQYGDVFKI